MDRNGYKHIPFTAGGHRAGYTAFTLEEQETEVVTDCAGGEK